jgi:type I restriction enzyme S subunit
MSWKRVKLESLCKMNSGGTPSRSNPTFYSGNIPWAKISDIEAAEGGIIYDTEEQITENGLSDINNRIFEKGTLLLAMYGSVGKVAFTGKKMSTNQAILGIRIIDESILDYSYLKYWFQTIKSKLLDRAVGGTLQNISLGIVKELEIPLPPLATQKRIAEILDAADALRRKDQELLKKYDELAQSIFIDMFGDPVKNEMGWDVKTIEELVKKESHSIKRGPFGGALKKEIFVNDGYLVYEQFHALNNDFTFERYFIDEEKYNELKAFDVKPKDIIISCSGIYLGKLAIVPENAKAGIINQALLKLSLNDKVYRNEFFVTVFSQENFKEKYFASERGAAIPNFPPMSAFKEFKFICPPIDLQNKFVDLVLSLSENLKLVESADSSILFNSLIQKAFKGEIL